MSRLQIIVTGVFDIRKIFPGIITDRDEQKNIITLIAKDSFSMLTATFIAVPVIQAFLIGHGASNLQLGMLNTFINIAVLLGIITFIGRIDSIGPDILVRVNRRYFSTIAILPISLVFFSIFGKSMSTTFIFIVIAVMWSAQNFFSGPRQMTDARVCQNIFRSNILGYAYGLGGIIYNGLGVLGGIAIKAMIEKTYGNISGYTIAFILSLMVVPGSIFFSGRFKLLKMPVTQKNIRMRISLSHFAVVIKNKRLKNAAILHMVRGLLHGMIIFILPLGVKYYGIPLSYSGYMVMISALGGIAAFLFITIFYDRLGTFKSVMIASLLGIAAAVGLMFTRDHLYFLLFVSLLYTGLSLIGISVPLGIFKISPSDFIGSFTGIRTLVMQVSEAVMSMIFGIFIMKMPVVFTLGLIGFLLCMHIFLSRLSFGNENKDHMKA